MNKTLKLFAILAMVMIMVCTSTQMVFAKPSDIVDNVNTAIGDAANDTNNASATTELTKIAGKVINLIQIASAVAAVVLIAVFGFKFILGSANEKVEYQKSFIPLIVGVVVVFAAVSIAKLLFGLIQ